MEHGSNFTPAASEPAGPPSTPAPPVDVVLTREEDDRGGQNPSDVHCNELLEDSVRTGVEGDDFEAFLMQSVDFGEGEHVDWTKEEDKEFEQLLIEYPPEHDPLRHFGVIAFLLISGHKSEAQVRNRYYELASDVAAIDAGLVPLPAYREDKDSFHVQNQWQEIPNTRINEGPKKRRDLNSRWTEVEHKLFLKGMAELGRGDWRGISRKYVQTKTPMQVASHAQKFDLRRLKDPTCKTRRRKSIHDITSWETQQAEVSEAPAASQHPSLEDSMALDEQPSSTGFQQPHITV